MVARVVLIEWFAKGISLAIGVIVGCNQTIVSFQSRKNDMNGLGEGKKAAIMITASKLKKKMRVSTV